MIVFEDEKFGKVIIYEGEEIYQALLCTKTERLSNLATASVVGYRDTKNRTVELLKNRYGPLEDYEMEQFILTYNSKKGLVFDSIESRFDILDL